MSEVERLMTIGQVAEAAGVATTTLRFYEREGILAPKVRNGAGYRLYDAQAIEQLRFVRSAQAVGFTLEDIRALSRLDGESGPSCKAEVRRLLELRLAEVSDKMKDLKRVQKSLGQALDRCQRSNGECNVLREIRPARKKRR
ncbi:MAG: MerR family transcriptional regulator [Planctomycetes bacterium]|nr:MerR family transcriptional regulator [Planctomycetota bacterium]